MPRRSTSPEPPVMTRSRALPIIVVAGIFDAMRLFFTFFWFWGPAMAGLYCTVKGSAFLSSWSLGLLGTKTAAAFCSAAAIAGGSAVAAFTTPIGVIMADAVGLGAFLIIVLWILMANARIFKVNRSTLLLLTGSLGLAEIPFIGSFPAFSVALWILYRRQIKVETAAHRRWEEKNANAELQARNEQVAALTQTRAIQEGRVEQEAANDEAELQNEEEGEEQLRETEAATNIVRFPGERTRRPAHDGANIHQPLEEAA